MVLTTGAGPFKGSGRGYEAAKWGWGGRRGRRSVVVHCTDGDDAAAAAAAALTGRYKAASIPNVLSTSMERIFKPFSARQNCFELEKLGANNLN